VRHDSQRAWGWLASTLAHELEQGGVVWLSDQGAAAGQQQPGHAGHGRVGVAAQNRGGGALTCGLHGTVPVGRVKWRSINFKNQFKLIQTISKSFKLWSIEKGSSWAQKIWNRIWIWSIWIKEQLSPYERLQIRNVSWIKNLGIQDHVFDFRKLIEIATNGLKIKEYPWRYKIQLGIFFILATYSKSPPILN
jgi:hypothetical protein